MTDLDVATAADGEYIESFCCINQKRIAAEFAFFLGTCTFTLGPKRSVRNMVPTRSIRSNPTGGTDKVEEAVSAIYQARRNISQTFWMISMIYTAPFVLHLSPTNDGEKERKKTRQLFDRVFAEGFALFWPPRVTTGTNQKVPLVKKKV